MKQMTFNKNKLAVAISILLGTAVMIPLQAAEVEAETDDTEVVIITGIRGSLTSSMNQKREETGVMDAINAEEMGKFPDTNLAESLQRITGVTVSRSNGEGSQITVRGFGPDFNLVTLNGRQMPATGNTRSYSLENLSSESVSALEVFKTARAEKPSGGLGAIVNIVTSKPLNSPGRKFSVSAKGINDTSNVAGDDVTPEISAIYSDTFADDTIGVAFSLSQQDRDFQQQGAGIGGWKLNGSLPTNIGAENIIDPRALDADGDRIGPHFFPQNMGNSVRDVERQRTNGQLTLQYAPTDDIVLTLDYTASEAITAEESMSFGVWFNEGGNVNSYELDENGTAIRFNEATPDYAHTARKQTTLIEAESLGFNMEWTYSDNIELSFDYHDSSNKINNGADPGSRATPFIIVSPANLVSKDYFYLPGQEIPQYRLYWEDGAAEASPSDFDPLFAQFLTSAGEATIEQVQFNAEWFNPSDSPWTGVKAGLASTRQIAGGYGADVGNQGPGCYCGNQAIYPDSMFTRVSTGGFLDQLAGGGSDLVTDYYYTFDFDEAMSRLIANFPDVITDPLGTGGKDSIAEVEEVTNSIYLQTAFQLDIADMAVDINLGIRYEETDVLSTVKARAEKEMVWLNGSEWNLRFFDVAESFVSTTGKYDVTLPNIDIKVEILDDLIGRFSAGKTITRAPLGNLAGVRSLSSNPKPGARTGFSGNTNLLPFESTNFDLSLEYYYDEGSYVSLGYFNKDVKNFIQTLPNTINVDGLRDPLLGPRRIQAEQDLVAAGTATTIENIFNQIIANGGGNADGNVVQNADDPLVDWLVTQPTNGDTKQVDGIEFAIQHMFGETGFGAVFNATLVDGDVTFDPLDLEPQSPLAGLSDSANFTGFYEKDGLSVKVTYAWRDEFLIGIGQSAGTADAPPQFGAEYGQWDMSVNYDVNQELTVFFEAVNLTNETEQGFGRYKEQFLFANQYGPRYVVGFRYTLN